MDADLVELVRQALLVGLIAVAPVLAVGFLVGIVMGLVQAATGIHEQLVGLVPRLLAMVAVLLVSLPWMVERFIDFFRTTAGGG